MTISRLSVLPLGSGLAIVLFRVHFKLFDLCAAVMVGQREINANFSGNRLYACPNRVRDRPVLFRRFHFSAFLRRPSIDLIHYPYSREASKNERARSAGVQVERRISLRESFLVDSHSDLRNVLPGRLPLEVGEVSICHINKVNPSPNRKPFPPARSARPQKIPLARLTGGRVATLIRGKTHSSCGFGA